MEKPTLVTMYNKRIEQVAEAMLETTPEKFPAPPIVDLHKIVVVELVAASVNYCYWYGSSNIRPLDANSTKMYDLLMQAFDGTYCDKFTYPRSIKKFAISLSMSRFPLLEERIRHLNELLHPDTDAFITQLISKATIGIERINEMMEMMIVMYPGFASDIFLKRLSLFFIQLNRRLGWFKNDIHNLHVPADYQVPKMLEHFGCLVYDDNLRAAIHNNELIPKGSIAECEIRAATVLTIKKLCELTKWTVADVDGYFFLKRHDATQPFHLTITTDY